MAPKIIPDTDTLTAKPAAAPITPAVIPLLFPARYPTPVCTFATDYRGCILCLIHGAPLFILFIHI